MNEQIIFRFGSNDRELWFEMKNPYIVFAGAEFGHLLNMGTDPCFLTKSTFSKLKLDFDKGITSLKSSVETQFNLYFIGPTSTNLKEQLPKGSTLFLKIRVLEVNEWQLVLEGLMIKNKKTDFLSWNAISIAGKVTAQAIDTSLEIEIEDHITLEFIMVTQNLHFIKLLFTTKPVSNAVFRIYNFVVKEEEESIKNLEIVII